MICPIPGCAEPLLADCIVCESHALQIAARIGKKRRAAIPAHLDHGWIYYLILDEKLKIGWTTNLEQRIKAYPPHAVVAIEHPGTRADERDLHRSLKPSLVAGREWYTKTPEVEAALRRAQEMQYERSMEYYRTVTADKPEWIARSHRQPCMPGPIDWARPQQWLARDAV